MAIYGSPDVGFVLLEGRPLHNMTTNLKHKISQVLDQTDGLGDANEEHAPVGQFMWEMSMDGFYNLGTGLAQEGLELAGNQVLMYSLEGNTIGDPFTGIDGPRGEITTLMERGKLHRVKANFKANFGPEDMAQSIPNFPRNGLVQAGLQTVTDVGPTTLAALDWNITDADYIEQETGSAIGFIGATAVNIDGAGNILFTIGHSPNDGVYADLIVFTAMTTAGGVAGEMVTAVAAVIPNEIERWTQMEYEYVGVSGASRSVTFACGLIRTLV